MTQHEIAVGPATENRPSRPVVGPFGLRAFRIGRVFGIDLAVDVSWIPIFLLITAGLSFHFAEAHPDWTRPVTWSAGVMAGVLFFLAIVLHELGHSVTSKALGLPVRSITLFLFGGLAQLTGDPKRPRDVFLIGIAGPAVSVALAIFFLAASFVIPQGPIAGEVAVAVFRWLGFINLVLAAFNLVPGHPLDGGHVLRAFVWAATGDRRKATAVASAAGSAFAFFLMALGGFMALAFGLGANGLWLILIGWFLMRASRGTALQEIIADRLGAIRAAEAMDTHFPRADVDESVAQLISEEVLRRGERSFLVERDGMLAGLVTLKDIKEVPERDWSSTTVGAILVPRENLVTIDRDETLWDALKRMDDAAVHQLPVTDRGRLVGVLTREHVLRILRNALDLGARARAVSE